MLSIRTRGKNGIYYIQGSVSLGDKHIDVKEFSTGTRDMDAASQLMVVYETKLRHQLMFGPAALGTPTPSKVMSPRRSRRALLTSCSSARAVT